MQLLAVLIHPPPQGDIEGMGKLDRPPRSCLGPNQCASVRKGDTGRGNVLSALLGDTQRATPTSCSSLWISWMREPTHWRMSLSACLDTDPTWSIFITPVEPSVTLDVAGKPEFLIETWSCLLCSDLAAGPLSICGLYRDRSWATAKWRAI